MSALKEKTYRLTGDSFTVSFILKSGRNKKLTIFDTSDKKVENHKVRAIRFCPNESTIFIDEQSEHAIAQAIIFENRLLETKATDVALQKFLDIHPDNVANGGTLFEELNPAVEASKALEYEEAVIDIKSAIRKKEKEKTGFDEIKTLAAVLSGSVHAVKDMSIAELKSILYSHVDTDPQRFLDDKNNVNIFEDPATQRKYIVLTALNSGVIRKSMDGRQIQWADKGTILNIPTGIKDTIAFFSDYLETDEGLLVIEEIAKRI